MNKYYIIIGILLILIIAVSIFVITSEKQELSVNVVDDSDSITSINPNNDTNKTPSDNNTENKNPEYPYDNHDIYEKEKSETI